MLGDLIGFRASYRRQGITEVPEEGPYQWFVRTTSFGQENNSRECLILLAAIAAPEMHAFYWTGVLHKLHATRSPERAQAACAALLRAFEAGCPLAAYDLASRRVLDDPDALGGLLGGLHLFGGGRGHLIVVVPILVPRWRPRLRVTSKFPGSIHEQLFVRLSQELTSPKSMLQASEVTSAQV